MRCKNRPSFMNFVLLSKGSRKKPLTIIISRDWFLQIPTTCVKLYLRRPILRGNHLNSPKDFYKELWWVLKYIEWVKFDVEFFIRKHGNKPGLRKTCRTESLFDLLTFIQKEYGKIPKLRRDYMSLTNLNPRVWRAFRQATKKFLR